MKFIFLLFVFISSIFIKGKGQSLVPDADKLKEEIIRKDSSLDYLFKIFQDKDKKVKDFHTLQTTKQYVDSIDKYILQVKYYLDNNYLDSALKAIHITDSYITKSKKALKMIPD